MMENPITCVSFYIGYIVNESFKKHIAEIFKGYLNKGVTVFRIILMF